MANLTSITVEDKHGTDITFNLSQISVGGKIHIHRHDINMSLCGISMQHASIDNFKMGAFCKFCMSKLHSDYGFTEEILKYSRGSVSVPVDNELLYVALAAFSANSDGYKDWEILSDVPMTLDDAKADAEMAAADGALMAAVAKIVSVSRVQTTNVTKAGDFNV